MNLYGFSKPAFHQVLGSGDETVLQSATALFEESQNDEAACARGKSWLKTLIMHGHPLHNEHEQTKTPLDGGLLTVKMETETHAFVVYSLARAVAANVSPDLSQDSSNWTYAAISGLQSELSACHFSRSSECPREYHSLIVKLVSGSPIFGEEFRTSWSFYSILTNHELAVIVPILAAAINYERQLPQKMPAELKKQFSTQLSQEGKQFAQELSRWFGQLHAAGQDAFVMWR